MDLKAWAVFPNHYHFVALSPSGAESLRRLTQPLVLRGLVRALRASTSFYKRIMAMKIDRVSLEDDFEVKGEEV